MIHIKYIKFYVNKNIINGDNFLRKVKEPVYMENSLLPTLGSFKYPVERRS